MYETIVHPVVGAYPTTTWPWRFARTPARIARPAPLFAEHNREILHEAGLDDDAIDALYAERHDRRRTHPCRLTPRPRRELPQHPPVASADESRWCPVLEELWKEREARERGTSE